MNKKIVIILIGFVLTAVLVLWSLGSIYPDWLWFENLGFAPVFWTMVFSRFGFGFLIWLLLSIAIGINLYVAKRLNPDNGSESAATIVDDYFSQFGLSGRTLNTILMALVLFASFYIASKGSLEWDMLLRYLYQEPFGSTDPIFHKDIGFYLFSLPLYMLVRTGLLLIIIAAGLVTMGWYMKNGGLQIKGELTQVEGAPPALPEISISPKIKKHLIFLGGIIVLLLAWGFYLKIFELLYSTQGPAFGASYTDVHIKVLVYRVLIVLTLGFAAILFYSAFKFKTKLIWVSGGVWIGAILVLGTLVPMLVQKIVVKPNELTKESPYIAHNIDYTRKAYDLNRVKEIDFEVKNDLSAADIEKNDITIQNIRIWDERPLLQTYRQIQSIRLYYDFNNVDVDRYIVNGQYRQVMLAARELVVDQLPEKAGTWVNKHLIYTHGYGLACSPVNEVTDEGLPHLFIKDVPPSFEPDLKIKQPEIYYGEKTDDYVLVKTNTQEFDYPKGDKNVYTIYQGKGGVPVKSFFRRLLFAFEFSDSQILFTNYLNPESRIMFNRRVGNRVRLIAPFLDYDKDPYMVVSEGRLFWIQDAFTTSIMYPYSRRSYGRFNNKGLNYIRNSVKVTVDAYNGDVTFYVIDQKDPIIKTYSKIFPDLFKPFNEMPADLKKHIRYPKDLFKIQVDTYAKYHMDDVQVFYNQEDHWQIPDELYGDSRQEMEPYYIIVKLPDEEKAEFLLMLPYTPSKKDNMIAWLAARSDLPNYGKLLVYKLPKEKLVYGPMQIEARVDQQTDISRELSLWGQRGSRVIRGNLMVIPVGDTFIYVEPVYLEAKQEQSEFPPTGAPGARGSAKPRGGGQPVSSQPDKSKGASLPELKRVIVAFGNRLVMEKNLDKALARVLDEQRATKQVVSPEEPQSRESSDLVVLALEHYHKAKDHLRQGKWAEYGRELENLEKILNDMSRGKDMDPHTEVSD
ncbi:MAG: UPF0182 family protein [Deltaproteobacteria bacterium]|nr:UPF0182 family protein [Deltaproteobacteria bacterium]